MQPDIQEKRWKKLRLISTGQIYFLVSRCIGLSILTRNPNLINMQWRFPLKMEKLKSIPVLSKARRYG